MLRKILFSTALVAVAGSALAADLPYRTAAPAPYVAAPVFNWTGFYVGVNAGAAFNNRNAGSIATSGLSAPNNVFYTDAGNSNDASFTGGVTAGYNMQFGSFVAGVEGDVNYLNRRKGGSGVFPAPVDFVGTSTTGPISRCRMAAARTGSAPCAAVSASRSIAPSSTRRAASPSAARAAVLA
jgi:hypothetical protein